MSRYRIRGVSPTKEDVHLAVSQLDPGLFENAFCKVVPDALCRDPEYCNVLHTDGAGTKSVVAYLLYKEQGDPSAFEGIAQDAIVMNLDDMLCVGMTGPFLLSNSIGRNASKVNGEVIKHLIQGFERTVDMLNDLGVEIIFAGGETADVGDLARTAFIDASMIARCKRQDILDNQGISAGDVIIGLACDQNSNYEDSYNSGIGSNGLTAARHELLDQYYLRYPETFSPDIPKEYCYNGTFRLTDALPGTPLNIGEALLSPTRTYAPIVTQLLKSVRSKISGIIHCTGGGQTKCLRSGRKIRYIKDNLFETPALFATIQQSSNTPWREMYETFNMGHRMEIIGQEDLFPIVEEVASQHGVGCQIIGRCIENESAENVLEIRTEHGNFEYRL